MDVTPEQIDKLISAIKWIGTAIIIAAVIRAFLNE